jgi:ADP-ribosyl-[dinitrogen reductase] hydrolase
MLLFFNYQEVSTTERKHFDRLLHFDISKLPENKIQSSGYVIHSLEASIWCFLNHSNYKETVLAAVNLGDDSDTTGSITGALCGFNYGFDEIPKEWISVLKAKELIDLHLS